MFIIGALVALGLLITVHEFGHFTAARLFGVTVEKFSLGFGPKLISIKKGATEYLISLIPLGGYIKMKGDEPQMDEPYKSDEFLGVSWWKRVLIVFAGPFANLILGFVLFTTSFVTGRVVEDQHPIIGIVPQEKQVYFQQEDRIISVNDNPIRTWTDIIRYTEDNENRYTVEREGTEITITTSSVEQATWYTEIYPLVPAIIGSVAPGMPAYRSGLKEGDLIIAVADEEVDNWYEMRDAIINQPDDEIELTIGRNDAQLNLTVDLETNLFDNEGRKMIGITQQMGKRYFERYGLLTSIEYGAYSTVSFIILNYQALFRIISKPFAAKDHLGGPVMIISMSRQTTGLGWGAIIAFVASISLILTIMNLLPIPVLDGGHIFFFLIEGIFRKPLPLKTQLIIQQIGFLILITLMLFVFYNDFSKLARRSISLRHQTIDEAVRP